MGNGGFWIFVVIVIANLVITAIKKSAEKKAAAAGGNAAKRPAPKRVALSGKGDLEVILERVGERSFDVMSVLRETAGMSLDAASDACTSPPAVVGTNLTRSEAGMIRQAARGRRRRIIDPPRPTELVRDRGRGAGEGGRTDARAGDPVGGAFDRSGRRTDEAACFRRRPRGAGGGAGRGLANAAPDDCFDLGFPPVEAGRGSADRVASSSDIGGARCELRHALAAASRTRQPLLDGSRGFGGGHTPSRPAWTEPGDPGCVHPSGAASAAALRSTGRGRWPAGLIEGSREVAYRIAAVSRPLAADGRSRYLFRSRRADRRMTQEGSTAAREDPPSHDRHPKAQGTGSLDGGQRPGRARPAR